MSRGTKDRSPQTERNHFRGVLDRRGTIYWADRTPAGVLRREMRADMIRAVVAGIAGPDRHILEIGCAMGAFTRALAARVPGTIVAVDVTPELVACLAADLPPNVQPLCADVERLPFGDQTFDALVGNAILHHLRLERAMPELCRVLRPGGWFCFTEPNLLNPHIFIERHVGWIRRRLEDSPGETAFVRWRLRHLLEEHGLEPQTVRPFDFLYPLLPAALLKPSLNVGRVLERLPLVAEIAGSIFIAARKPFA